MSHELTEKIEQFKEKYLNTPAGQEHLASMEAEMREVKKIFQDILEKHRSGESITDDVLKRLLPHTDSTFHRQNEYRVSTWPCIRKDVRGWFEATGWKKPEEWDPTAELIVEAIQGLLNGDKDAWYRFVDSDYRRGFGTGFISPILFCLNSDYPVITSKVIKTYKYCTVQLGAPDSIDAQLSNYLDNTPKVHRLVDRLAPIGIEAIQVFDIFCHFMVAKRLGGGNLTKPQKVEPQYEAWLFVANPEIFMWDEVFEEGKVEWTGSKETYPQKLIREQIRTGDRVFGYQTAPHYEINCEVKVESEPYRTADGLWAVDLVPVRKFHNPISLATLQNHPNLSTIKFVQTPQISISGISQEQLTILDELIAEPSRQAEISSLDRLRQELLKSQHDTRNHEDFEKIISDVFEYLGFEVEHVGGSGDTDVIIQAQLGAESYVAVIDGKTCRKGEKVGQVNYQPINAHKEANAAHYAAVVAPAFSGGNTVEFAAKANVTLITTSRLLKILRQHDYFPFDLEELRYLFEEPGLADGAAEMLGRIHAQHENALQLVNQIIHIFEEFQRQQDRSEPLAGEAIHLALQVRAGPARAPQLRQVSEVLSLLSNPFLGILTREDSGYILRMSVPAARKRVSALQSMLTIDEVDVSV